MAKMSTKALLRGRAKRNIGDQLLQAVGEMKAGKAGNVHRVAMSAVTPARTSAGLHDAVAAATRWSIGALDSDQNAPAPPMTPRPHFRIMAVVFVPRGCCSRGGHSGLRGFQTAGSKSLICPRDRESSRNCA